MAALGASSMRKFEEKINRHRQKGIEEEAEFLKIMSECAAVKQIPIVSIPYGMLDYVQTVQSYIVIPKRKVLHHFL